jgi:hypothetical protein
MWIDLCRGGSRAFAPLAQKGNPSRKPELLAAICDSRKFALEDLEVVVRYERIDGAGNVCHRLLVLEGDSRLRRR